MKTRYQVTSRDKDGNLVARNIRYTESNAKKLATKLRKQKRIKTVKINKVK